MRARTKISSEKTHVTIPMSIIPSIVPQLRATSKISKHFTMLMTTSETIKGTTGQVHISLNSIQAKILQRILVNLREIHQPFSARVLTLPKNPVISLKEHLQVVLLKFPPSLLLGQRPRNPHSCASPMRGIERSQKWLE